MQSFQCIDCGGKPLCPQLKDEVWCSAYGPKDLACWTCTEKRLGRDLTRADMENCGQTRTFDILADRIKEGRWYANNQNP